MLTPLIEGSNEFKNEDRKISLVDIIVQFSHPVMYVIDKTVVFLENSGKNEKDLIVPICISTNSVQGFPFLHILVNISYPLSFDNIHPNRWAR